jgi:NAD(P)-dependent dehydrogenase (short-subunit alcohol dehydrogenase family)
MSEVKFDESLFSGLKDKVVVITGILACFLNIVCTLTFVFPGASSGIGLATARFFSGYGSKIIAVDLNPLPEDIPNTTFRKVDLTKWDEQYDLFEWTTETFGHIDIAFLNAGVGEIENVFVDEFNEHGRLKEPVYKVLAVNLMAPLNGTKIAIHFMKRQKEPGSIVITGSGKSRLNFKWHS